jgi:hypothetical protein
MAIAFKIPRTLHPQNNYSIYEIFVKENDFLTKGSKILDFKEDMHSSLIHDCPSINFYRLVCQESLWLRNLFITKGQMIDENYLIGIFTKEMSEVVEPQLLFERNARLGCAGIIHQSNWFNFY